MLTFVEGRVSERKLRLFLCACCRLALEFFRDELLQKAVDLAETYDDETSSARQLDHLHRTLDEMIEKAVDADYVTAKTSYAAWVVTSRPLFDASVGVKDAVGWLAGLVSNRMPLLAGKCLTTFVWTWPTLERERAILRDIVGSTLVS
jgi:hypothetical protein